MPINLSTTYIGSCSAAVLLQGGSATRIYYQAADGAIHEAAGVGPAVKKPLYADRIVVKAANVRINSPMAAIAWKDAEGVEQIRLYFIDQSNLLHEYVGTSDTSKNFVDGYLSGHKYKTVANSGVFQRMRTPNPISSKKNKRLVSGARHKKDDDQRKRAQAVRREPTK
ncbi:hypothetical protein BYT27DRAFT_7339616 [Phlegmacium glaucopus]|nr:hypothetical protein BYT27DRAFT_7339616 [Phlegmacium glaucopus]